MDYYATQGDVRQLKMEAGRKEKILRFTGGNLLTRFVLKGSEQDIRISGEDGVEFSDGQMLFMDFGFNPNEKLNGQFTVNVLGNVADTNRWRLSTVAAAHRFVLGGDRRSVAYPSRRGVPISNLTLAGRERVEIYDFEATYEGEDFDLTSFLSRAPLPLEVRR